MTYASDLAIFGRLWRELSSAHRCIWR